MKIDCVKKGCHNTGEQSDLVKDSYHFGGYSEEHGFLCSRCIGNLKTYLERLMVIDGTVHDSDVQRFINKDISFTSGPQSDKIDQLVKQFK